MMEDARKEREAVKPTIYMMRRPISQKARPENVPYGVLSGG